MQHHHPDRPTILPGIILLTCFAALYLAARLVLHVEASACSAISSAR
jgi:hypothetical protein